MRHMLTIPLRRNASGISAVFYVICIFATTVYAQDNTQSLDYEGDRTPPTVQNSLPDLAQIQPIRTDSPRDTLSTFLRLTRELEDALLAYRKTQSRANRDQIPPLVLQFRHLFDLSEVPRNAHREVGIDVLASLLDIIGRVNLPPMESIPDANAYEGEEAIAKWRIPRTPITIVRIDEGPREGEFLFSARTISIAPSVYQRMQHLPLRSSLAIDSWNHEIPQMHGPLISARFVSALPNILKRTWLEIPIWKIFTVVIMSALMTYLLVQWHRVTKLGARQNRVIAGFCRVLTPAAIIVGVSTTNLIFESELFLIGPFARMVDFTETLVIYLAAVWAFWIIVLTLFDWIILSPKIPDDSLDANLLRLIARVIGFLGAVVILAIGAEELGLPVLSMLAGLGIGGLAVALAIRPTLENLIGGAILYMDRPVRVGDFCSFGTRTGRVESIGLRSTQVRARDRTLISIPNAAFADMEIVNWAKCDRMQILTTIGLRYETESDQLRYVLVKLREMFHAHPEIDRKTVRVRFTGYGTSSLDIEIRVYAMTREFNEFYAIREDVFLRVKEIVGESGTGFAFPSQTLYMGRDDGLDRERSDSALQEVKSWRRSRQLPFPQMSARRVEELAGTLDYPPYGSPDTDSSAAHVSEEAEPLSAESLSA